MTAEKLIQHINPPQYLSTLIAYTLASDVLHIFEKEHPNDLRPRKALELIKPHLDGEDVSRKELRLSADAAIAAIDDAADADDADDAAYAAANAAADAAGYAAAYAAAAADVATTYWVVSAVYWAAKATSEEHAVKLIYSMMPQIIDYAIKNQEKLFTGPGDFTEVFDKLDDATKEKVVWNMELFR